MSRIRILFLLATTMALAVAFAACGGSSDSGSSDVPPKKVLNQTFSGKNSIDSGKVDATLKIEGAVTRAATSTSTSPARSTTTARATPSST